MTTIEIIIFIIAWGTCAFFLRDLYKVIVKPAARMKGAKTLVIVVLSICCTMLFLSPFFIEIKP